MNRRYKKGKDGPERRNGTILVILSGSFLLGIGVGCLLASYLNVGDKDPLKQYINTFLVLMEGEYADLPTFLSIWWDIIRWPLAALIFGMTLLSVIALPLLFAVRGFLFSYSISIFLRLYGISGLIPAAAIFAVSSLLSIVALFMMGRLAFSYGWDLCGTKTETGGNGGAQRELLLQFLTVLLWTGIGAAISGWLTPGLLRAAAGFLN